MIIKKITFTIYIFFLCNCTSLQKENKVNFFNETMSAHKSNTSVNLNNNKFNEVSEVLYLKEFLIENKGYFYKKVSPYKNAAFIFDNFDLFEDGKHGGQWAFTGVSHFFIRINNNYYILSMFNNDCVFELNYARKIDENNFSSGKFIRTFSSRELRKKLEEFLLKTYSLRLPYYEGKECIVKIFNIDG